LAYTNRFNIIASRIRSLRDLWEKEHQDQILYQLHNLRRRVKLIRLMQGSGVLCMFTAIVCMFFLFYQYNNAAHIAFGLSLILMLVSLYLSLREIHLSVVSLDIVLSDLEKEMNDKQAGLEKMEQKHANKIF
jgi:hypothetical protein